MNIFEQMLMFSAVIAMAAFSDWAWVKYLRPSIARKHGWGDLPENFKIPALAWVGVLAFVIVLFVLLPYLGIQAGLK